MENTIKAIKSLFRFEGSSRSLKAKKNIIILFLLNGVNFVATFLLVPLTINYLGPVEYGIWLTISSVLTWLSFMDFGIGNGLRNKLAETLASGSYSTAKSYVSTAYAIFMVGILVLWLIFIIINGFVNWSAIFNAPAYLSSEVNRLVLVVFLLFSLQLFFKLIYSIVNADQRPAVNGLLSAIVNALTLLFVFIIYKFTGKSLFLLGTGSSVVPNIIFIVASIILFLGLYKKIAPSIKSINLKYSKYLFGLGMQFFIIQLAGLVLFATDNLIITQLFGPSEVTTYNVAYKYFYYVFIIFNVVLTPFWSAYTDAYVKDDFEWIKNTIKKIKIIWLLLSVLVLVMLLMSNFVYKFWVGNKISIPFSLSVVMALFVILGNWNNIFAYFINGVGKIRLQLYTSIITAIINIPLSVYLAKYLNMGITGVMTATCICVFFGSVLGPLQYSKIINKKANGVWGK